MPCACLSQPTRYHREGRKIRVIGSGLSPNGIGKASLVLFLKGVITAVPSGLCDDGASLLNLANMDKLLHVDAASMQVKLSSRQVNERVITCNKKIK